MMFKGSNKAWIVLGSLIVVTNLTTTTLSNTGIRLGRECSQAGFGSFFFQKPQEIKANGEESLHQETVQDNFAANAEDSLSVEIATETEEPLVLEQELGAVVEENIVCANDLVIPTESESCIYANGEDTEVVSSYSNIKERLLQAKENISKKHTELKISLSQERRHSHQLKDEVESLASLCLSKEEKYNELKQQLQAEQEKCEALMSEKSHLEIQVSDLLSSLEDARNVSEESSKAVEELTMGLREAHDEVIAMSEERQQTELENIKWEKTFSELRDQFEARNEKLVAELQSKNDKLTSLQEQIDSFLKEQSEMMGEIN